jgi:Flp pilus assembly pilin Flp
MEKGVKQLMWTDIALHLRSLLERVAKDEKGQTLVEYALIIALVSIALIAALNALTGALNGVFTTIGNALKAA